MLQMVPTVSASPVERERLRPIAHRTEKIQQMLDEMVDLAQRSITASIISASRWRRAASRMSW
jgi:hypothetical protein